MGCVESFLSEPTFRNKPGRALIPAQSLTVASGTSMLRPQWTSKSTSSSSNAILRLISYLMCKSSSDKSCILKSLFHKLL